MKYNCYNNIPAVILTTIHHDGPTLLSTIRSLGRHKVPVYVIAKGPLKYSSKTRYTKDIRQFYGDISDEELIILLNEVLLKFGTKKQRPVLIYISENDIHRLRSLQQFINTHFTVIPSENVLNLLEKTEQLPFATRAGFNIPKSIIINNSNELSDISDLIQFPVIVKPLARHTTGGFIEKVMIFETNEMFLQTLQECFNVLNTKLLVQEYVPGNDENVLFFMASCEKYGTPRAYVSGHKLRQMPPGAGLMSSGVVSKDLQMETLSINLCKLFQVQGFIGIEAKRHEVTNEIYYIETNFRPEAISALAEVVGTNLVLDMYLTAIGQPCCTTEPRSSGSYLNLQYEIDALRQSVKEGTASWSDLFKKLPRPTAYSLYAHDDPLPFLRWLVDAIVNKLLRPFLKIKKLSGF